MTYVLKVWLCQSQVHYTARDKRVTEVAIFRVQVYTKLKWRTSSKAFSLRRFSLYDINGWVLED